MPGALGITYLPPPPDVMLPIMNQVMDMANRTDSGIDPLVLGTLVSFGFVFARPFMDGNGRLSRFLFSQGCLRPWAVAKWLGAACLCGDEAP
ncbi:MAG: Fic family protein [Rhodoferax sp.]|nr:Fic family protein [Rhodoferax sp.]PIY24782.1 MAG: hypothetical protein COZ10_06285 [Comamonadaceae bacterium CG_4_10_14_3_um_filter_60_75]